MARSGNAGAEADTHQYVRNGTGRYSAFFDEGQIGPGDRTSHVDASVVQNVVHLKVGERFRRSD